MDDWEKYEQLADLPKYKDDFEFAMYGATNFGMKAIPILATAPTYGDKYPELIKAACEKSLSKGDTFGRACDIDEEYLGMIEEVRNRKDDNGYFISNSEAYKELVNMGIVGDVLSTIEEYVGNFDCDWRYPSTEVSIVPKGEASPADVAILNKINDLFNVEACYN